MRLEVRYLERKVGRLDDSTGRILFQYDADWLRGGIELSPFYLPLQEGVITLQGPFEGGLAGLFADALPDYWGRSIMDRRLRESGINPASVSVLKRLALVGSGSFGALSYHPAESEDCYEARSLEEAVHFSREVLRFPDNELPGSKLMQEAGSNPGGRFPKICVGWQPNTGQLVIGTQHYPEGYLPCLLKLDLGKEMPQGKTGLCRSEYELLERAERCGILCPRRWLLEGIDDAQQAYAHLLVQRFDRSTDAAVHLHSFSGIAHKLSIRYANSYEELFRLTSALTRDQRELEQLYRRMVFNVLAGNRDDHVRNHAFIMPEPNQWKLSPAYDLTPTPEIEEHSLSIHGKWSAITRKDLLAVGKQFSIRQAASIIDEIDRGVSPEPAG